MTERNITEAGLGDQPITDWQQTEKVFTSFGDRQWLALPVQPSLPYRDIYFFIEASLTDGGHDYWVKGELQCLKAGRILAKLPASIGQDTSGAFKTSLACFTSGSDNPGPGSIRVALSTAIGLDNVFLNPTALAVFADEVRFEIHETGSPTTTLAQLRVFLGVLSRNVRL